MHSHVLPSAICDKITCKTADGVAESQLTPSCLSSWEYAQQHSQDGGIDRGALSKLVVGEDRTILKLETNLC